MCVGDLQLHEVDNDDSSSEDEGDKMGTTHQNMEDCDAGGSSCYSNTVFYAENEDKDISSVSGSTSAVDQGTASTRPVVRGVQFDVSRDPDPRLPRPQISAVVTKDRRPTVFEKKFRGTHIMFKRCKEIQLRANNDRLRLFFYAP